MEVLLFQSWIKEIFPEQKEETVDCFLYLYSMNGGKRDSLPSVPNLPFLSRGLKLPGIGKDLVTEDITYSLKSRYVDVRVPIIWNIGKYDWALRPYIYAAPIVGFSTGGYINLNSDLRNGYYEGYSMDLTDANMASTYLQLL